MVMAIIISLAGLAILIVGAEILVRASVSFATLMGIPPIVVGLTIVALGTSAPELAVGIDAALRGNADLAVGNIAGTNIVNILLILGLSAALVPLDIERRTVTFDLPVMVFAAILLLVMAWDGHLSRIEGAILVFGAFAYTWSVLRTARNATRMLPGSTVGIAPRVPVDWRRAGLSFVILVIGIAIIVQGANLLVDGATDLARLMGVSEAFIGLTIVAIGTSAPELVTTMVSTIRGNRDVAIGNLIGSSAYNILAILGLTVMVPQGGIPVDAALIRFDIPIMTLVAIVCIPVFLTSRRIARWEGMLFVLAYIAYVTYLVMART